MTIHVSSTGGTKHKIVWRPDSSTTVTFNVTLEYNIGPSFEVVQPAEVRVRYDYIADKMISLIGRPVGMAEREQLIYDISLQIPEYITLGGSNAI